MRTKRWPYEARKVVGRWWWPPLAEREKESLLGIVVRAASRDDHILHRMLKTFPLSVEVEERASRGGEASLVRRNGHHH
jgi:hypothetical protein